MDALPVEETLNVFANFPKILNVSEIPIQQSVMAVHHDQRWGKGEDGDIIRPKYIAGEMVPVGTIDINVMPSNASQSC